jgi:predicted Zn finger-like uncharacterized protein
MKATCPKCSTVYKVADDKVPAGGAQIKCPKCETVFVVTREAASAPPAPAASAPPPAAARPAAQPPAAASAPAAPVPRAPQLSGADPSTGLHAQATPIDDLTALFGDIELPAARPATVQPPAPQPPAPPGGPGAGASSPAKPGASAPAQEPLIDPTLAPNMAALTGEAVVQALRDELRASDGVRDQARGRSAIRAQSGTGPAKPDLLESFRVRTARGLTYDFPNTAALERWLNYRDDLAGCEVSLPGGAWMPATEFLAQAQARAQSQVQVQAQSQARVQAQAQSQGQTAGTRPAAAEVEVQPSQPLLGIGERAPLPRIARREPTLAPLRARAGAVAWSLLVLSALALLAGVAATTTRYGWLDLSDYLPLERVGIVPPERLAPLPPPTDGLQAPPPALEPDKAHGQALQAAREAMALKRFSRAAMEYNRALAARPGSPEALEGLAKAYQALGDGERARAVLKKAQEISHR